MSTHTADVIKIKEVLPHTNADKLELVHAFDYQCVVRKEDFKPGDLGVFFHPETMLDTNLPEFSFLADKAKADGRVRIRIVRLRQEKSYGLLIPAPKGVKEGDNLWEKYNCQWYEPKIGGGANSLKSGLVHSPPPVVASVPDPENIRKFSKTLEEQEVIYTTKLHGSFFRATYQNGELFVGSKSLWRYKPGTEVPLKKYESLSWFKKIVNFFTKKIKKVQIAPENSWWSAAIQNPWIEGWLKENPGYTIMGEMVGPTVQKGFDYGFEPGRLGVYVFAVTDENGEFIHSIDLHHSPRYTVLNKVPVLYEDIHDYELMKKLAEEKEDLNGCGHLREGVVATLRGEPVGKHRFGRIVLKYVSDQYLEKT
jgi:RNA ligase (TIGR02306 family)